MGQTKHEILPRVSNTSAASQAFSYYPRLAKVKRYVDRNLLEAVDLSRAAEIAGLEKTYFSKFFHDKTGVCFHDWLSQVRVTRAADLMRSRDLSITEVAFAVGFRDLRTFERVVEKCTGMSPRVLKKTLQPNSG
jgi:two-component system response regulator YesN